MKCGAKSVLVAVVILAASPAAAEDAALAIAKCEAPLGTIAVVDGDAQGWTKYRLESPRALLTGMIAESGCFTLHDPASGTPANFLMSAIAGNREDVAQGVNVAKAALTEGALRTGALGVASGIPVAGAALRLFGGFGGKKTSVAAGLRVINPATGATVAAGSGEAKKTTLSWGGVGGGYGSSKHGKLLSAAFATAFNELVGQATTISAARPVQPDAQTAIGVTAPVAISAAQPLPDAGSHRQGASAHADPC